MPLRLREGNFGAWDRERPPWPSLLVNVVKVHKSQGEWACAVFAGESAPLSLAWLSIFSSMLVVCLLACLFACLPACSLYVRLSLCLSVIGGVSSCGRIDHQPTWGNRTTIGTRHIGEACHCYTCILYNGYTHNPQTKLGIDKGSIPHSIYVHIYIYISASLLLSPPSLAHRLKSQRFDA